VSIAAQMAAQGYLTISGAADRAGVPYHTMRNWMFKGLVASKKKAGKSYISLTSIEVFLAEE